MTSDKEIFSELYRILRYFTSGENTYFNVFYNGHERTEQLWLAVCLRGVLKRARST